MKNNMSTL